MPDGYLEIEVGRFDAALICERDGHEVARVYSGEEVRGYDRRHARAVTEWADWYDLPVVWKED